MKVKNYSKEQLMSFYETMIRIRRFEEETFEFYKKGLMAGLAHLYLGEEAIATGVCAALNEEDYIGSTHRGHGHLVARGADTDRMMAEILGKKTGYSNGKGGSMHIMAMDKGILGANGIVGGEIPIATGAAYSANTEAPIRLQYPSWVTPRPTKVPSTKVSTWQQPGIFLVSMLSKTTCTVSP